MRNITPLAGGVLTVASGIIASISLVGAPRRTAVATEAGLVIVEPLSEEIIRVSTMPADGLDPGPTQAISLIPDSTAWPSAVSDSEYVVTTPKLNIHVDRATGRVSFRHPDGTLILSEAEAVSNVAGRSTASFLTPSGELFFGAGERGHRLPLNGDTLSFYNRQNYGYTGSDRRISQMGISVPWIISDGGYGILFDDYSPASLTIGDTIRYNSTACHRPLSYYFVGGGDIPSTLSGLADLTGHQPLPPFWSLGYITSKYGYGNRAEALGVVDTLQSRGYPLDGMVLDLYWYGVETDMGRLEWDTVKWPDHAGMLRNLKDRGVNTVLITQPYINKKGAIDNYNLLDSLGMLTHDAGGRTHDVTTWVGEAGMLDISNPDTREWLWERLRPLTAEGVAGWWGDLGEPEVHPATIVHANGLPAEQYHNIYGNEWSRTLHDGLRADFPERRPFLMMRGGSTGLQRYGVFPWTTDVSRSWGGFQPQVKLMLSAGLSGLGYMSSDVGGFAVDPANPTDPELYLRWLQQGVFSPMLRTHAQLKPEPYHYPEVEADARRFIEMRYRWLPYNYTLAYENAAFGLPLARPLNFRNRHIASTADIEDEYMWGDEVLVAPVMRQGATSRLVTFPEGEKWVNFLHPAIRYDGGTTKRVNAPLSEMPIFVKAGSFIPLYDGTVRNTSDYDPRFLTVNYYPGKRSEYVMFDDDRKNPRSLEEGQYQLTTFRGEMTGRNLQLSLSAEGSYEGMPEFRLLTLRIPGVARPKGSVSLGDGTRMDEMVSEKAIRQYGWAYDPGTHTLSIRFPWGYTPQTVNVTGLHVIDRIK